MRTCTSRGARGTRACLAHVSVQKIGMGVICLTVLDILLPVHEPGGEELKSTLDDDDQLVDLFACDHEFTLRYSKAHFIIVQHGPPPFRPASFGALWQPARSVSTSSLFPAPAVLLSPSANFNL